MNTDEKNPTQDRVRTHESKDNSAGRAPETQTAIKGGAEPAKRQAERDWQDSSKEAGE
jgi:hypothetical protein